MRKTSKTIRTRNQTQTQTFATPQMKLRVLAARPKNLSPCNLFNRPPKLGKLKLKPASVPLKTKQCCLCSIAKLLTKISKVMQLLVLAHLDKF